MSFDRAVSSNFRALGGNAPKKIGDYKITKLMLYSPNISDGINIAPIVVTLELYEDILSNSLNGRLTILDAVGFRELVPLMGEETIILEAQTVGIDVESGEHYNKTLEKAFRVYKITPTSPLNEHTLSYILHLCSPEYIVNKTTKIQKNYVEKISTIVQDVYDNYLQKNVEARSSRITRRRDLENEETLNVISFVSANWNPFTLFNFLAKRAISTASINGNSPGALYLFYETFTGFHFDSIETALSAEPSRSFTYAPVLTTDIPKEMIAKGYAGVQDFKIVKYFDTLENLTFGMYASRLITHDIVKMKYNEQDFYYIDNQLTTSEKENDTTLQTLPTDGILKVYDKSNSLAKGRLSTNYADTLNAPEALVKLYPTNFGHDLDFSYNPKIAGGFKQIGIKTNRVENWLQYRESQFQQLNNIKIIIVIPGDSHLRVGQTVNFKVPSYILTHNYKNDDAFLAGKFLISKIKHVFTPSEYKMELELVKDSLEIQPPGLDVAVITQMMAKSAEEKLGT